MLRFSSFFFSLRQNDIGVMEEVVAVVADEDWDRSFPLAAVVVQYVYKRFFLLSFCGHWAVFINTWRRRRLRPCPPEAGSNDIPERISDG